MNPGEQIGNWVVEATIGEGGMGCVLRCHHVLDPSQLTAVKLLLPDTEGADRERMIQEFKLLRQLSHPYILKFLEAGVHDERVYLVTELLVGETLKDRLLRGPVEEAEAVVIFRALAQGLAAAHERGIWHRDLKPANVFLSAEGPKILDFGIAVREGATRLTRAGFRVGTPAYMALEAFQGESGAPADLYSLGLMLWETLTGKRAFTMEKGEKALIKAKVQSDAFDPGEGFSAAVRAAVAAATDPEPDSRPTAQGWLSEIPRATPATKTPVPSDLSTLLLLPCRRCGTQLRPGTICAVCETNLVPVRPETKGEAKSEARPEPARRTPVVPTPPRNPAGTPVGTPPRVPPPLAVARVVSRAHPTVPWIQQLVLALLLLLGLGTLVMAGVTMFALSLWVLFPGA